MSASRNKWSNYRINQLRDWAKEGLTSGEIASQFCDRGFLVSRSAVAGAAARLEIKLGSDLEPSIAEQRATRIAAQQAEKQIARQLKVVTPEQPEPKSEPIEEEEEEEVYIPRNSVASSSYGTQSWKKPVKHENTVTGEIEIPVRKIVLSPKPLVRIKICSSCHRGTPQPGRQECAECITIRAGKMKYRNR